MNHRNLPVDDVTDQELEDIKQQLGIDELPWPKRITIDPDTEAKANLAIAEQYAQGGGDEYQQKVAFLVTDPWLYFCDAETNQTDPKKIAALRKAWYKKFIRDHPRYSEGYIGSRSTLNKWKGLKMAERKTFTQEVKDKAIADLKAGKKAKDVAQQVGCSYNSLMIWKKEAGLPGRGGVQMVAPSTSRDSDAAILQEAINVLGRVMAVVERVSRARQQMREMLDGPSRRVVAMFVGPSRRKRKAPARKK